MAGIVTQWERREDGALATLTFQGDGAPHKRIPRAVRVRPSALRLRLTVGRPRFERGGCTFESCRRIHLRVGQRSSTCFGSKIRLVRLQPRRPMPGSPSGESLCLTSRCSRVRSPGPVPTRSSSAEAARRARGVIAAALRSDRSSREGVKVQVLPSAPRRGEIADTRARGARARKGVAVQVGPSGPCTTILWRTSS